MTVNNAEERERGREAGMMTWSLCWEEGQHFEFFLFEGNFDILNLESSGCVYIWTMEDEM